MEDIPLETMQRYLKELGIENVSEQQMMELKVEIAKRLQEETQPKQNNVQYQKQQSKLQQFSESSSEAEPQLKQKPRPKSVVSPHKKQTKNKYFSESSSESEQDQEVVIPTKQPQIQRREFQEQQQKQAQFVQKTNPYLQQRPTMPNDRGTKLVQLLGPNRLTLAQKQKQRSDPLSNLLKYEKGWALQGAPQDREKRQWTARITALQQKVKEQQEVENYYE
ncbi:Conserved_hypothetical protein [Hexamita inflata]|uniref:Uncharacterized protein n=1 Tax=Hexamita inflata TaxID=28002 RepID=A0AA86V0F5_9EUKA|nr:Conserved hypothetical protein [Hexamita inflata]CAI9971591.1 Conserved hypothetical protein [Hexamita inflata]